MELSDKQKKKFERVVDILEEGELGVLEHLNKIDDRVDEVDEEIQTLKSDVDDLRDSTEKKIDETKEELKGAISIIELTPGPPGDNYVLTEADKSDIAGKIKVPIVEKVIETIVEKTEVVKEQPIITREIKEVAVTETPEILRDKLESLRDDQRLDKSAVKGIEDIEKKIDSELTRSTRVIGGQSGLHTYVDSSKKGLLKSIDFKAGTNTTVVHSKVNGLDTITFNVPTGAGGVSSFNSRTGAVTPQSGDYTTSIVAEGSNLYFTDERAQDAVGSILSSEFTYTDSTPEISINSIASSKITGTKTSLFISDFTEASQDAVGAMVNSTLTYTDATPSLGINLGNENTWTATQTFSNGTYAALFLNGKVGIGTSTPTVGGLQVSGGGSFTTLPGYGNASLGHINSTTGWNGAGFLFTNTTIGSKAFSMVFNNDIAFFGGLDASTAESWFTVGATGFQLLSGDGYFANNVGIGVTNPTSRLDVRSNTDLGWDIGTAGTSGVSIGGRAGSSADKGSLFISTSGDGTYLAGLGFNGSRTSLETTLKIRALGVKFAGYSSNLTLSTTNGTTETDAVRIDKLGNVVIGPNASSPNSTLQVSGSLAGAFRSISSARTLDSTDFLVKCTGSSDFTVTLPTAASISGRIYVVKNSGSATITLATTSSQTIDGSTTLSIGPGVSYTVMSDGSNWIIF